MAEWTVEAGAPEEVLHWAMDLNREAIDNTFMLARFKGTGSNAVLQVLDEMTKEAGAEITTTLRLKGTGDGVAGDNTLKGNEEALVTHSDTLRIDQLRHAFKAKGRMSQQRVRYRMLSEMRDAAADWFSERFETSIFNHLCGNTAETDTRYTGMVATVAPDANHFHIIDGVADDETLTETEIMQTDDLDQVLNKVKNLGSENAGSSGSVKMRPIKVEGADRFIQVMHPNQTRRLQDEAGSWFESMQSVLQGGTISTNPLFTGALGVWKDLIFYESAYITHGVDTTDTSPETDVKRSIVMGAQAGQLAFGREGGNDTRFEWVEEDDDFKNQIAVAVGVIWGFKKTRYNSEDFGVFTISSFADDPA